MFLQYAFAKINLQHRIIIGGLIFDLIATSYVANNFYSNYKTRNKGQSPWPKQINQINQM